MANCYIRPRAYAIPGFSNYIVIKLFWAVLLLSVLGLIVMVLYYSDDFVTLSPNWKQRKLVGIIHSRVFDQVTKPTDNDVVKAIYGYTTMPQNNHTDEKAKNSSLPQLLSATVAFPTISQDNSTSDNNNSVHSVTLQTEKNIAASTIPSFIEDNDCLLWVDTQTNWQDDVQPQIKLDPNKFLYPGLIWGPNNQIVGFWQSVYLAIRLNRTLVIPRFNGHGTTGGGIIPASQRIEVQRIRRLVSSIPVESFSKTCNFSFDVVLQAQILRSATFERFKHDTGMETMYIDDKRIVKEIGSTQLRLTDEDNVKIPNIPAFPPANYQLTYAPWITGETDALKTAFNTSARCALFAAPFSTIKVQITGGVALPLQGNKLDPLRLSNGELYSAVVNSVRRPLAIVNAVERYRKEVLGNETYVAVHWRYDFKDWGGSRCRPDHPNKYSKMCDELRKITPEDVANGIFTSLNKAKVNQSAWKHVYIASPPVLRDFADQVVKVLQKLNSNMENPGIPLDTFLTQRYQPCWKRGEWSNEQEIFSLAEMEVLAQSEWFFFAAGSTFSSNVRPMRWQKNQNRNVIKKFEKSVYEVAKEAMIKRTNLELVSQGS